MQLIAREIFIQEVENRLWTIKTDDRYPLTVEDVQRNPARVNETFPCINLFEETDRVAERTSRGGQPVNRREFELILEFWRIPSTERLASAEALEFYQCIKWVLLKNGSNLGLQGFDMTEVDTSNVLAPVRKGDLIIGMGVKFLVRYIDTLVDPTQA